MALEGLFLDRNIRKHIKESILEGAEIGINTCSVCGTESSLISVYGRNLCEMCCNKVLEAAEDYDTIFTEEVDDTNIGKLLGEGYMTPADMNKLNSDAQSKFGGSVPDLMKSYGLSPHKDWDDRISKGKIYIKDTDIKGGKSRINQFIIDYDLSFETSSAASKLVPDKDGTSAPVKVKNKAVTVPSNGSQPAKAGKVATQSSSHIVQKGPQVGPGIKVDGDDKVFNVTLTQGLKLKCERTTSMMGNNVGIETSFDKYPNAKYTYYVDKDKNNEDAAKDVIDKIQTLPYTILSAFEDGDMKDGYVINSYPAYSFIFDEKSFDGKNVSLALCLNGKKFEKSRAILSDKALFKRVQLDKELRAYMDGRLKVYYPMLFNGTANIKTSIGTASTELFSVETNDKYKMGEVKVVTELGNVQIPWSVDGERFRDKELTHNTACDVIFSAFPKIIPGWNDPSIEGKFAHNVTQAFELKDLDDNGMKYDVAAVFDLNDLYDSGNIVLQMSVIDDHTGEEQPKERAKVIYKQAGVPLKTFLKRESKKLHAYYFKKSDMTTTLTQSAKDKVGNPSKKIALLSKLANILKQNLATNTGNVGILNLGVEIEDFEVNSSGKVTDVSFRVYDYDSEIADTSTELSDGLRLEKTLSYLKVENVDDSPKGMSEYGPSVVYRVSDIEKFSDLTNLAVLEHLIFEAFGIIPVNESGRKMIFA